jgi:hypothetical protein
MKLRRLSFVALLLVAALAHASDPMLIYVEDSQSVSDTNTTVTFTNNHSGGDSTTFVASEVFIKNTGSVTCYVDLDGTAVAANDWPILAGEAYSFSSGPTGIESVGVITASSTTTVAIRATRPK